MDFDGPDRGAGRAPDRRGAEPDLGDPRPRQTRAVHRPHLAHLGRAGGDHRLGRHRRRQDPARQDARRAERPPRTRPTPRWRSRARRRHGAGLSDPAAGLSGPARRPDRCHALRDPGAPPSCGSRRMPASSASPGKPISDPSVFGDRHGDRAAHRRHRDAAQARRRAPQPLRRRVLRRDQPQILPLLDRGRPGSRSTPDARGLRNPAPAGSGRDARGGRLLGPPSAWRSASPAASPRSRVVTGICGGSCGWRPPRCAVCPSW